MFDEYDPYIGTKIVTVEEPLPLATENVNNTWNSICKLFENRKTQNLACNQLNSLFKTYVFRSL
jgi:hypothetical protein